MPDEKPKHKPSPKRTLEEVLKSLQDLVRNDVVSAEPRPAPSAKIEGAAPAASGDQDELDGALDALDELITHELIEPAERAEQQQPRIEELPTPGEEPTDERLFAEQGRPLHYFDVTGDEPGTSPLEVKGTDDSRSPTLEINNESRTPYGVQVPFPFNADREPGLPPPFFSPERKESSTSDAAEPSVFDEDEPGGPTFRFEEPPFTAGLTEEANLAPGPEVRDQADDGIPVLKDVANLNAETDLPEPANARDIAIRVIARLNIERRKAGEAPLDIKTIDRLQRLLRDALTGPEDGGQG